MSSCLRAGTWPGERNHGKRTLPLSEGVPGIPTIVTILGVVGGILFFGRFYVQWIVSEIRKECVIPMAFWYMSILGSLMLFPYAFFRVSPGGTLGLCFNAIVYARNLVHLWREQGFLTSRRNVAIHALAGVIVTTGTALTFLTWKRGYHENPEFWVWTSMWAIGQGLVAMRFAVQWMVTEWNRKSIVPRAFWQLSIAASLFHTAYFLHRGDTILTIGTIADTFVYIRSLHLTRKTRAEPPEK